MTAQLRLPLGADEIATLASYLGASQLVLEDAARDFLSWGRVLHARQTDVPERVLIEAACAIWTVEELAELRTLQARVEAAKGMDGFMAAWRAESLYRARLIRRVSPRWANYWEGGWQ